MAGTVKPHPRQDVAPSSHDLHLAAVLFNSHARSNWSRPVEGLRAGAMLHTLEGIVRADVRRIEHDERTGRFEEEVTWHDSYEAEQHLHHYGKSIAPVCWSLVGYSSGFVSACMGTG